MKKVFLISFIILSFTIKTIAQSTTITPEEGILGEYTNQKMLVQTTVNNHGFEHTNGTVSMATYVGDNAAWLMTKSNHPLYFSTNNNVSPLAPAMAILTNGNIGIGIFNPSEKLHVVGNARISGLSGNGLKYVRVNNFGILLSTPLVTNLSLSRATFLAVNGNTIGTNVNSGGVYCIGNTVGSLEAPVNLPDGAVITNVAAYYSDNSPRNVKVILYRRAYTANTSALLGTFSSTGSAGNMDIQIKDVDINTDNVVDNSTYVYYIRVSATVVLNNNEISTIWGDGTALTISQIKITYSY